MGQNVIDDYGSRNPVKCDSDPKHCKICDFIKDCDNLTIAPLSFELTKTSVIGIVKHSENLIHDVITGQQSVPFHNRKALKYLQDNDETLLKVKDYLTTGKRPTVRQTKMNKVKRYLQKANNMSIAKDGCMIVLKRDQHLISRELVVIPDDVSLGLIYAMHINLNHPSAFQLSKILDTKFFILDKEAKVKEVTESCTLCCSVSKIPREIESFKPNLMPDHPGQSFTADVAKIDKKNVMVSVENFSGFLNTSFINSEKAQDLLDGLILAISPLRSSLPTNVRVDQAAGFKSLSKTKKH